MTEQRMRLFIILAVLTAVVVACGNNPRMTVQEYAVACAAQAHQLNNLARIYSADVEDISPSELDALEDTLDRARRELSSWTPPEELEEFHSTQETLGDLASDMVELTPKLQKAIEDEDEVGGLTVLGNLLALLGEYEELQNELERHAKDFSPATTKIMADAGCIEPSFG